MGMAVCPGEDEWAMDAAEAVDLYKKLCPHDRCPTDRGQDASDMWYAYAVDFIKNLREGKR